MQPVNVKGHGRRIRLAQTLEEDALQAKFRDPLVWLDDSRHLEQTVRGPHVAVPGRVAATHDNALVGLVQDFKVVGD